MRKFAFQLERDQVKWEPVHRFDHATTQESGAGSIPQEAILFWWEAKNGSEALNWVAEEGFQPCMDEMRG